MKPHTTVEYMIHVRRNASSVSVLTCSAACTTPLIRLSRGILQDGRDIATKRIMARYMCIVRMRDAYEEQS